MLALPFFGRGAVFLLGRCKSSEETDGDGEGVVGEWQGGSSRDCLRWAGGVRVAVEDRLSSAKTVQPYMFQVQQLGTYIFSFCVFKD